MKNIIILFLTCSFLMACSKKDETAEFLKQQEQTMKEQQKKKAEANKKWMMYTGEPAASSEPKK